MMNRLGSMSFLKKFLSAGKSVAAGFTLIEILVGMSIFSVAVLGLAAGTVGVIRANQTSHLRTSAINLAQGKLEELKAMTATAFSGLSCPCSDNPVSSGASFNRTWVITQGSPVAGVNRIDVTVTWTDYANQNVTVSSSVPQGI